MHGYLKFIAVKFRRNKTEEILTHIVDMLGIDMVECHHLMHLLLLMLHWPYHLQLVLQPDYLFGSLNSQYYDVLLAQQPIGERKGRETMNFYYSIR